MTTYTCKACGTPAPLINGVVVPACKCAAPIVAHLKAHATGTGGAAA